MSDRKAKLQDPQPVHQKLLPRVETRVKQLAYLVSIAGAATRAVLILGLSQSAATRLAVSVVACLILPHLTAEEKSIGWIIGLARHGISCPGKLGFERRDVGIFNMKSAKDMAFGRTVI